MVSQRQILNLLGGRHLGLGVGDEDEDDDDDMNWGHRLRRRRPLDPNRFPKIPSEKGRELMNSGTFGANDVLSPFQRKKKLARRILDREMGLGDRSYRRINQGVMAQVSHSLWAEPWASSSSTDTYAVYDSSHQSRHDYQLQ